MFANGLGEMLEEEFAETCAKKVFPIVQKKTNFL
jgi:hypothetical protein